MPHDDSSDRPEGPPMEADTPVFQSVSRLTIARIENRLIGLSPEIGADDVLAWLDLTSVLLSRAKEIRRTLEQFAVAWITQNGPIEFGDTKYTVGDEKVVKCVDIPGCARRVLEACGGDLDRMCAYLASSPFKYGSVRSLIGDDAFARVFSTEYRPKLVDGRPQKQLIRTDKRFSRRKEG